MKLLVAMGLADRNMMYHIYPITLLREIDTIMVVRNKRGPDIDKVHYYCPPSWSLKIPVFSLFIKLILMIYLSIREKPEFIHGYLLFPHGILAFIAGILTRKKVGISLLAGPVELYAPGKSPVNTYPYCNPLPQLSMLGKISKWILDNCDVITVTGNYTKRFLSSIGINESKVFVLPHVIDNRFKFKSISKEYDIVYIGRLAPVKHVETLLKSIKIIKNKFPFIKVAIVGDGECKAKLENLSKNLGLDNNVNFAGYQPNVWDWYNLGKMAVLTSEREGFPYSVIEALKCGLPVISSNCGDVCDVIKDGYNGILVNNYHNYHSFAKAALKLLQDPQITKKYTHNALKTSQDINKKCVVTVWKKILSESIKYST